MLGQTENSHYILTSCFRWGFLAFILALTLTARCWNSPQVFVQDGIHFVDADCYSRMTRVQAVLAAPFTPIRHHDFENFPEGTTPHTTAPLDYTIAVLAWLVAPFDENAPDFAGAIISPLLSLVLVAFLWWWAGLLKLPFRGALLFLVALSPILVQGFLLGRPDHQSMVILLCTAGLASEFALWRNPTRAWDITSGAIWGLALWVSLFEPLILLIVMLTLRLLLLRKPFPGSLPPWGLVVFGSILAFALLFDGWRGTGLILEMKEYYPRWSADIGELQHTRWTVLFNWTGWLLIPAPFLLFWKARKEKSREALALLALLLIVTAATLWHQRWGYFLAVIFALSLPSILSMLPGKPAAWTVFLVSLWPIAREWDSMLFPDRQIETARIENREDYQLLHQTAAALISTEVTPVLAPWWLSPPLAYWSSQPCIAGSSHQSMPGIVDSARFYLTDSPDVAREILNRRKVQYVIAYEPSRILTNSTKILKEPSSSNSLGTILYEKPHMAPRWLQLVQENKYFKVYEFTDPK